ncbi:MAG: ATP-binding protein [Nitrosotalea sp.]
MVLLLVFVNFQVEFEDSGDGISKENISKIFEPLFTTKQNGTGLGLSSVRAIIESHGGSISIKSPPTVFTILLPQN